MASDFKLADCLTSKPQQLCWDCANACGGCEWSKDFQPVPGWDAIFAPVKANKSGKPKEFKLESYAIRACPKFVKEERHGKAGH